MQFDSHKHAFLQQADKKKPRQSGAVSHVTFITLRINIIKPGCLFFGKAPIKDLPATVLLLKRRCPLLG